MKFYERAEIGRETESVFQAERNSSGNRFSFIVFGLRDWADKSGEDSAITCATSNLRIGAKRKRKIKLTWFLIDSIWKSRKVLNLRNGNLIFWEVIRKRMQAGKIASGYALAMTVEVGSCNDEKRCSQQQIFDCHYERPKGSEVIQIGIGAFLNNNGQLPIVCRLQKDAIRNSTQGVTTPCYLFENAEANNNEKVERVY